MSAQDIRLSIFQIVNETKDDDLLITYFDLLKTLLKFKNKQIVGYDIHGKSITASYLEQLADEAEEQVNKGNFIRHADLMKEVENLAPGYDIKGKPVTAKEAEKPIEQVKNGNYMVPAKMMESVEKKNRLKELPIMQFERSQEPIAFEFGSGKHLITYIADDFDAPLEEFRDYM